MRPRPTQITAGVTLLLLFLLVVPASAATSKVALYDQTELEQVITDPPARRCLTVQALRVPRVVNSSGTQIEAHTTRDCSRTPARIVANGRWAEVSGLRAIRVRS